MQFVLTYDGTLHGTSDPLRQHAIRRTLHPQLLKQWTLEKTLVRIAQTTGVDNIASGFSFGGFRFVPLVTRRLDLVCRLEIMLLRPEEPGNVAYTSGAQLGRRGTFPDTDNRIGVLFDALAVPKPDQVKPGMVPDASEDPFYCLVEDDSLISSYEVRTGRLLRLAGTNDVSIQITVTVAPTTITSDNMAFLGRLP